MKRFACIAVLILFASVAIAATQTYTANPGDTVVINVAPAPIGVGSGSGSGSGSGAWNGTCPGFPRTVALTLDWQDATRLYTKDYGGFGSNDALVVSFTTGSVSSGGSLPRIASAEYNSPPSGRIAYLSSKPCDFTPQTAFGANMNGNSITAVFALGTGSGFGYYPVLELNTTYYLNIKNAASSTCAGGSCDMFVDLVKAGGL